MFIRIVDAIHSSDGRNASSNVKLNQPAKIWSKVAKTKPEKKKLLPSNNNKLHFAHRAYCIIIRQHRINIQKQSFHRIIRWKSIEFIDSLWIYDYRFNVSSSINTLEHIYMHWIHWFTISKFKLNQNVWNWILFNAYILMSVCECGFSWCNNWPGPISSQQQTTFIFSIHKNLYSSTRLIWSTVTHNGMCFSTSLR